ncbi:DUF58 domain-containing protein [Psychromicrobium xiongbiense]|uniref:DUF58 domain-containing protein n=1 Tax=Psychromicrobium xiongbiense TaxID=3051184 RepID=UPI002554C77F|nr:DUF58 domain-containing protein [Psychromicrobium sp. YIM S02556]
MASGSLLGSVRATLRQPFSRNGSPTRLHPVSLWVELRRVLVLLIGPLLRTVGGWLRRVLGPVFGPVSALGWVVLAVVVLLWVLGAVFHWQEALAAALVGTLVLVVAVAFILGRSAYGVTLDLALTRVAVGDQAVGSVTVTNTSARPLLPATLELPVGENLAAFHLPRLRPAQLHEDLFAIPTARRAVIVVGPVRSVRADPFHVLRRQVKWTDATDLYVHPRTVPLAGSAAGFLKDLEGLPSSELSNADVSFHALRDYVAGDDRRHIHWKTTARTNTLMVRQFEETRRAHIAIALSINTSEYAHDDELELAISVAGSIAIQAKREQRELSLHDQRGPLHDSSARRVLDDLTRIVGAANLPNSVDLVRTVADAVPGASVVFIVVGTHVTAAQLRAASAAIAPGIRCFAIRCSLGEQPRRNNIADLTVLTVGDLNDLGSILRKAIA